MRVNPKSKTLTHPLFLLALVAVGILFYGCRTDEVAVPPLTGPSGARLFITIEANPDHLLIHRPGQGREHSTITIQLKNQQGQGVPNEPIKLRITNSDGSEVNIGNLSQLECSTDSGGFCRITYSAPNSAEQPVTTRIYILAILENPAYVNEVTDRHALDLEFAQPPINCVIGGAGGPVPSFTVTPATVAINTPVCFDAQGSSDPNGVIVASVWNFGDGKTASGLSVCHSYANEGSYNVTLTIQDNDRNCASLTQVVTVTSSSPTCNFTISPTPVAINVDEIFNASTSLDVNDDITGFQWNFGDGTTGAGKQTHHTFRSAGTFTVTLTIHDSQGNTTVCTQSVNVSTGASPTCVFTVNPTSPQPNDTVTFDGSGSSDSDGTIDSFDWNFGDGGGFHNNIGSIATHAYTTTGTFTATLRLTDNDGNVSTCTQTITVTKGTPPTCSFTVNPTSPIINQSVNFDGSASADSDGTITQYDWNFGDDLGFQNNLGAATTHTYTTTGTFTVTLRITDNDGNIVTCTQTVTVTKGLPPTCSFTGPSSVKVNQTANFDASASADPDGTIVQYDWNFGDGGGFQNNIGPTPSHAYTTATGSPFTVTLRITDNDGNVTTCTRTVTVTTGVSPTCSFTFSPNAPQQNQAVNFDASLSSDPDGTITSYEWNFGEGAGFTAPSGSPLVSHTFTSSGSFLVTLRITDNDGNIVTCQQTLNVASCKPTISAISSQANFCSGGNYTITGTGFTGASAVTVNPGNASQTFVANTDANISVTGPAVAFATGSYTITVTNACGDSLPFSVTPSCP